MSSKVFAFKQGISCIFSHFFSECPVLQFFVRSITIVKNILSKILILCICIGICIYILIQVRFFFISFDSILVIKLFNCSIFADFIKPTKKNINRKTIVNLRIFSIVFSLLNLFLSSQYFSSSASSNFIYLSGSSKTLSSTGSGSVPHTFFQNFLILSLVKNFFISSVFIILSPLGICCKSTHFIVQVFAKFVYIAYKNLAVGVLFPLIRISQFMRFECIRR